MAYPDSKDHVLKVGDRVSVPCVVTALNERDCVTVQCLLYGVDKAASRQTLTVDSKQVVWEGEGVVVAPEPILVNPPVPVAPVHTTKKTIK